MNDDIGYGMWRRMVNDQYQQQDHIIGPLPTSQAERAQLGQELALGLTAEIGDYLKSIGHNRLAPDVDPAGRPTRVIEIVDLLKYVLALAWLEDATPEELYEEFVNKTSVVARRYAAELDSQRVCVFDIDGVVADLDGAGYPSSGEAEQALFFDQGRSMDAQPISDMADVIRALKRSGWTIVMVTSRKRYKHRNLEWETYRWLDDNDIPCDRVLFAYDKAEAVASLKVPVEFAVEDSAKHALDLADAGIAVYYVGNEQLTHEKILTVSEGMVWRIAFAHRPPSEQVVEEHNGG